MRTIMKSLIATILILSLAGCTSPGGPQSPPSSPPAAPRPEQPQSLPGNGSAPGPQREAWEGQATLIAGAAAVTDDGHQLSLLGSRLLVNITGSGLAVSVTLDLQREGRSFASVTGAPPLSLEANVTAGSYVVLVRGADPPSADAALLWSYHAEATWA